LHVAVPGTLLRGPLQAPCAGHRARRHAL